MSEGVLARWSRLKDEARRQARTGGDKPECSPPDEATLTSEEIAALPKLEELTAESDITAFLRRGVPTSLRNAALRKIWLLDPAIRDFAGHARDYDYDWNTPGGAPGHGPLGADDDVAAMVRRVLNEPLATEAKTSEAAERVERDAPAPQKFPGDDHA